MTSNHNYDRPFNYISPFQFRTREEYLEWRAGWRQAYAALSIKIREAKSSIRGRPHVFGDGTVQSRIHGWRIDANEMMLDREESKRAAHASYLAAKQTKPQAA
jgi:hypothetical protein